MGEKKMLGSLKEDMKRRINQIRGIEEEHVEEPIPDFVIDKNYTKCYVLLIDQKGQDLIDLKKLSDRVGCETTVSHTGVTCMERVRKDKYDVIFLAKELPRMNGFQTLRNIRNTKDSKCKDTVAYALLSANDDTPEEVFLSAGFAGALHMPVDEALFMREIAKHVNTKALPEDPRLWARIEARADLAEKLQHCGVILADGLCACKDDMEEYRHQLNRFCDQYENSRGKISQYLFEKDVNGFMNGTREVREQAKLVGARYLVDLFDDHVNMSKDDSLDIAETTWMKTMLDWEKVVVGVASCLGRDVDLIASEIDRDQTNGIRLTDHDAKAMLMDVLRLIDKGEENEVIASMDRMVTYDMSETMRLKVIRVDYSVRRGEMEEAKELITAIVEY
ncbi:MAG: response regulator [Eubacterium sp.]|nr:response regulator [Eubacterium sp.]